MKPKRTGLDVLHQLHAAIRLARAHPERVDEAARSMTPEQLRKAHEGLTVLIHCIGPVAATTAADGDKSRTASLAATTSASSAAKPAAHAEPATESP